MLELIVLLNRYNDFYFISFIYFRGFWLLKYFVKNLGIYYEFLFNKF